MSYTECELKPWGAEVFRFDGQPITADGVFPAITAGYLRPGDPVQFNPNGTASFSAITAEDGRIYPRLTTAGEPIYRRKGDVDFPKGADGPTGEAG